jgi:5'(3')-deoxyribonucleotidase
MKIYIDLDCTLWDTIGAVNEMYNEDFNLWPTFEYVPDFRIRSWNFEELKLGNKEYFDRCFDSWRFFEKVKLMPYAQTFCQMMRLYGHKIIIVSMGSLANIQGKLMWLKQNFGDSYDDFIGIDMNKRNDKAHIDMSDGVIIDDVVSMLKSSNASEKICFGEKYPWNEEWNGTRCETWKDVIQWAIGKGLM